MTFQERINDKSKTPISEVFVSKIKTIAELSQKHEDEIYQLWIAYCEQCKNYDQSPVLFEFCQWNNLPEVQ